MWLAKKTAVKTAVLLCAAGLSLIALSGLSPKAAGADNIVQGFESKEVLQPGILVALDKSANRTVKTLPAGDADHLFGVVIDPSDAPFTFSGQNLKVYVATSGTFPVLVSSIGGPIKPGDFITVSNLAGISQRATSVQSRILGQAESAFDGKSNVITTSGKAAIGKILVQISAQNNPLANNAVLVPSFLRKASNAVAGRSVPAVRIYAASAVFLFSAVVAVLVLWSGVRGSMIALGRNPLSRKTIFRGMYKVVFAGVGVFILGLAGVYLLLKI